MKQMFRLLLAFMVMLPLVLLLNARVNGDPTGDKCETCHKERTRGLYSQWAESMHAEQGVTCVDCHGAERGDDDGFMHEGTFVATLVTPQDCGWCHDQEAEEAGASYHATAGKILDSQDAYLAHVTAGEPAVIAGCEDCHGTKVEIDPKSPNRLALASWPNSGIGRINPDGSLGACSACHMRHSFKLSQVRRPETCSKCHLGPDHPQKEIYEESKHGIAYYSNEDKMNLGSERWVVGQDYYAAPVCATCHMSATKKQPVTHDVGQRISWTLRPPISTHTEDWQEKRDNMQNVCATCHSPQFYLGQYYQFDGVVNLYNERFAKPATAIMNIVRRNGSLENSAEFSNGLEWTYWELWHHEGRRARQGASMMGPDYTWWRGLYEVSHNFYFEFIPEVRLTEDMEAIAYIDSLLQNDPMHNWINESTDNLKRQIRAGKLQRLYKDMFNPEMSGK